MSNPHEMIYINELQGRLDTAVARFFEHWKECNAWDAGNYPLTLSLIDWLDQFQAWLDIDEFDLPATLHPEIEAGDCAAEFPAAKAAPFIRKVVDNEKK